MKTQLVNQEHGYRDYDVTGLGDIHRACVPFNIKNGDIFNVYYNGGIKKGYVWEDDLNKSLLNGSDQMDFDFKVGDKIKNKFRQTGVVKKIKWSHLYNRFILVVEVKGEEIRMETKHCKLVK